MKLRLILSWITGIYLPMAVFAHAESGLDRPAMTGASQPDPMIQHPIRALIIGGDRGPRLPREAFIQKGNHPTDPIHIYAEKYHMDNYDCLRDLFKNDGFNAAIFVLNDGTGRYINWLTKIPGFQVSPSQNNQANLQAAKESGFFPIAELLVGGIANETIARQHPEWRACIKMGQTIEYMGPQICSNSPYWKESLLPLYRDLFSTEGKDYGAFVLWEGPIAVCDNAYCRNKCKSEGKDEEAWKKNEILKKWQDLKCEIRTTGWSGPIIGGGWAAYEWEEEVWDSTFGDRSDGHFQWPEFDGFRNGSIDYIMPELLVHSEYGAHLYRREDLHYVWRSLMYERSLFGEKIIPNVELIWRPRIMTPDELLRWLLMINAAGFRSYSVVSDGALYLNDQVDASTRSQWRAIFKAVNQLPWFGRPMVRFQFVMSEAIEKRLLAMPIPDNKVRSLLGPFWCPGHEFKGKRTWQSVINDSHVPPIPSRPTLLLSDLPKDRDIAVELEFANLYRHSLRLGLASEKGMLELARIHLNNSNTTQSITLHLPAKMLAESSTEKDGKLSATIAVTDLTNTICLTGKVIISDLQVRDAHTGELISRMMGDNHYLSAHEWYRRETSRLFKKVDCKLGGGAIINEKRTQAPDQELYGQPYDQPVGIMIVPVGMQNLTPKYNGQNLVINVKPYEDLEKYSQAIEAHITKFTKPIFTSKTNPLITVSACTLAGRPDVLTVVNHSPERGSVTIPVAWKKVQPLVDGSKIIGRQVDYKFEKDMLTIDLGPYGCLVVADGDRKPQ